MIIQWILNRSSLEIRVQEIIVLFPWALNTWLFHSAFKLRFEIIMCRFNISKFCEMLRFAYFREYQLQLD